jgi:hypothetical protein
MVTNFKQYMRNKYIKKCYDDLTKRSRENVVDDLMVAIFQLYYPVTHGFGISAQTPPVPKSYKISIPRPDSSLAP